MSVIYVSICDISEIHITVYLEHVRTFREDRLPFATWIKSESWINCSPQKERLIEQMMPSKLGY